MKSLMRGYSEAYAEDMDFLNNIIWPKVYKLAFCHDSISCMKYPASHPFPVKRGSDFEHVGQVFDGNGLARAEHIALLKKTPVNKDCTPH